MSSDPDIVCRRFRVEGRVQGVWFRASTAREAERLGLSGWARNLPDGAVLVLASGTAHSVRELEEWLAEGPSLARVDQVTEVSTEPGDVAVSGFTTG